MDSETIDTGLDISEVAELFREVVRRRPLVAKASNVEMYTPDMGPWIGVGGLSNPDFALAVDLTPPSAGAGGTVILIAESRPTGTRVVVSSVKNSVFNLGAPVKATRKRLIERLQSAPGPQAPASPKTDQSLDTGYGNSESVDEIGEAAQVASVSTSEARRLPADIVAMMERFGRHEFDPMGDLARADTKIWEETQAPLQDYAREEPVRFVKDLADAVVPVGGWPTYGAAHTIYDLVNDFGTQNEAYAAILDGSLEFLRANHVPPNRVKGFERDRWVEVGEDMTTWLPVRDVPSLADAPVPELAMGETLPLAQLTSDADSNRYLVTLDENGTYHLLIDAIWSIDDPHRVQNEWESSRSLYDLYVFLGRELQAAPFEYRSDLDPYFPLPRSPLIS